jgi:outer membrane protein OmpA-like peptidoglycan-associated protein
LTGSVNNLKTITPAVIHSCAKELALHGETPRGQSVELKLRKVKKGIPSLRRLAYVLLLPLAILAGFLFTSTAVKDSITDMVRFKGRLHEKKEIPQPALMSSKTDPLVLQDGSSPKIGFQQVEQSKLSSSLPEFSSTAKAAVVTPVVDDHQAKKLPLPQPDFKLIIPFDRNSISVPTNSYGSLDELAGVMQSYEEIRIVVKGYTDTRGDKKYNKRLSAFRADIVRSYLVGKGIDAQRIESIGMGEENPIASNATRAGQIANRRVEIELATSSSGSL